MVKYNQWAWNISHLKCKNKIKALIHYNKIKMSSIQFNILKTVLKEKLQSFKTGQIIELL